MAAENGTVSSIIFAFLTALSNGDIFLDFSKIADFKEHDDNEETNRRQAIEFYQKFGLKYLSQLDGRINQDQYLMYASLYNRAMEEASIFQSVKNRYLGDYLGNIMQIKQKTQQQQFDIALGYSRRAYYSSLTNSIFTQVYIRDFERAIIGIEYKESPDNMLKMVRAYYYLSIASYVMGIEEANNYLQKCLDLIDELNPFGLSPVLSFTFVQIFISVVDLIFSFFDKTPNIEWIKTNTEKIFSIVGNLYRKEQLLELAKKDGQYGLIKNKKVVIDFRYQSIDYSGVGHLFIVTRNSKVGVYNCSGEKILAVKYNEVDVHDTYIQTKLNNETAYYNL